MARPEKTVSLSRLIGALNSLDPAIRQTAVQALREHDPDTYYFIMRDGRIDAVASENGAVRW